LTFDASAVAQVYTTSRRPFGLAEALRPVNAGGIPAGEKPYLNRVREKKGMRPNDVRGGIFGTIIVP
jgi:hypothetical protein